MEIGFYGDRRFTRYGRLKVAVAVMGGVGLAGAVGSAVTGNSQANATKDATESANATQLQMNSQNLAQQQSMYDQNRADLAPYRNAGYTALSAIGNQLQNGTGFAKPIQTPQTFNQSDFMSDPGYQFQIQQGEQALNRSAAAKGGLLSGGATKSLLGYDQGLANTTYGDAFNRYMSSRQQGFNEQFAQNQQGFNELASIAGLGQTANAAGVGAATSASNAMTASNTNAANNISSNTLNGLSTAAAQRQSGYAGAINGLGSAAGSIYQTLKNPIAYGGSYGTTPSVSSSDYDSFYGSLG